MDYLLTDTEACMLGLAYRPFNTENLVKIGVDARRQPHHKKPDWTKHLTPSPEMIKLLKNKK